MNKLCLLLSGIVLAALSLPSFAARDPQGAYLEGNIGTNYVSIDVSDGYDHISGTGIGGFALVGNFGYQFNPYIAAETGISLLDVGEANLGVVNLDAKGIIPVNDVVSVFGKLGVATPTAAFDAGLFMGAGAEFAINDQVGINAQFNATRVFDGVYVGTLSAGVTYHLS